MVQFVDILLPPGPSVLQARDIASITPGSIPRLLADALSIRQTVFVEEQNVPAENELDSDDPRSWHWVAYASASENGSAISDEEGSDDQRRPSTGENMPIATIRLIPPPHKSHYDGYNGEREGHEHLGDEKAGSSNSIWDGREPYVKLGRLATLKDYRKIGFGRLLAKTVIEWAAQNASEVSEPTERAVAREQDGDERSERWKGLILVHAQKDITERFWSTIGFVRDEGMGEWWEDGILHVGMWRRIHLR